MNTPTDTLVPTSLSLRTPLMRADFALRGDHTLLVLLRNAILTLLVRHKTMVSYGVPDRLTWLVDTQGSMH